MISRAITRICISEICGDSGMENEVVMKDLGQHQVDLVR